MKTATNQNRLSWFFVSLEGKLMNNSKLIGSVFLVGMSMILCAKTLACICPPCPPCHTLIGSYPDCDCSYDCTGCQSCVSGSCVNCGGDPTRACCDNIVCYSPSWRQCCGYGDGTVCNDSCCDSWACQYCDGSGCSFCLSKAVDYSELQACNKVPDPTWPYDIDGCSTPTGDNPSWPCTGTSFYDACAAHDMCYQTCGSDKAACDSQFDTAMNNACAGSNPACWTICQGWRTIYRVAVELVGTGAYRGRQVDSCACCDC